MIRSMLAGFFLLLFAFCITPKQTMHNLVASHSDAGANSKVSDPYQSQLTKAGFHCQVDNLITESPFVADTDIPSFGLIPVYFSYQEKSTPSVDTCLFSCYGLRGPPAC